MDTFLSFFPIFIVIGLAFVIPALFILLSKNMGKQKTGKSKMLPFECGVETVVGDAKKPMSTKFYLIAMCFLIFDIEVVFIYPWALLFKKLGLFGFVEMAVFLCILLVGLIYVWKKGALNWELQRPDL